MSNAPKKLTLISKTEKTFSVSRLGLTAILWKAVGKLHILRANLSRLRLWRFLPNVLLTSWQVSIEYIFILVHSINSD